MKDGNLSDAIEACAGAVLAPDGIAIVCVENEVQLLANALNNEPGLIQAANRLKKRIALYICSVDAAGELRIKASIRNSEKTDKSLLHSATNRIFDAGLSKLFSAHHVLVTAPSGFAFVKPSGERSTRFLRAEDALTEIENVHFLSFALLRKLKKRDDALKNPIDVICIDTMAIAAVAYALSDLYCTLLNKPRPRVVSFHSHEGLKDFDFPLYGTSLCIISASSSLRLERLWKERSYCHQTETLTLLTFDSATDSKGALFSLKDDRSSTRVNEGLRDIRIAGERFAPEDLKPKKILLKKIAHASKNASLLANHCADRRFLAMQGKNAGSHSKVRPLFIYGDGLVNLPAFSNYLRRIICQKVPASVGAIVHQDDTFSAVVANKCAEILGPFLQSGNPLRVINHSQLDSLSEPLDKDNALLVVAAVVGRGSKLLSISRDLRTLHTGAKTYLIGAQIAESDQQITSLKSNLGYSAEGSVINVETFASVAIGESLSMSYKREHEALSQLPLAEIQNELAIRVEHLLGTTTGIQNNALLPTGASLVDELFLRPDFAYWDSGYEAGVHCTPSVLMTVAAILQQARESKLLGHENRLGTDAFQQVVLDPENFARYNDGVIQGALLRAALPGELDYSSEREASRYMADFMSKVFIQHEQPQGEAALEFALAWYTGVLKLAKEHADEMVANVSQSLIGESAIKSLLRILLRIDMPPQSSSALPAGF
ncbi:hypothetical protein [Herminiimonas aquatilis]|uniref:Uncharacterized protein n=1 Tax=Herminiimonas aquatilis TaxID=345342 RepID=A0ABW2J4Q4_9BURK